MLPKMSTMSMSMSMSISFQSDMLSAICKGSSTFCSLPRATAPFRLRAFSTAVADKPSVCTADELHYVSLSNSDWKLALWRYNPSPLAPPRNHPLLLLSGVGTNAIGYDLSPESSFARYMSSQGFETWILEVRGAGLSVQGSNSKDIEQSANAMSEKMEAASESATATNGAVASNKELNNIYCAVSEPEISTPNGVETENVAIKERVSGFLSESQSRVMFAKFLDQISKLLVDSPLYEQYNEVREKLSTLFETKQNAGITSQITDLSQKLVNIIEEGQLSVSPQLFDLQARFTSTIEDFQKQLDLMVKYDWDFDHYMEEDVPAAIEYIMKQSMPKDGKLLAIGHSMGGILLYSMLSRFGFEGKDSNLAAVVTLASSLDYTSSKSTLKLLLPLADPAQALNVPVVPLGAMLAAAYPLSSRPPYVFSWLNTLISAEDMMDPDLLKRLVLNNFCTIPAKLVLQLTTAFRERGLCNRNGTFFYKDHLHKNNIPILAIAGDQDLICPPEAVEETVKLIPEHLVTYKVFGEPEGSHYAHYDLVGGRLAVEQVYPCIIEFLSCHDK
ncbi:hypothetical protein GLYMA_10G270400v4 [Glycine max]|uniref:AB hydrolase-1 domain-containing protein n=3 Tax=Glycine subgen. Soja TaxID=1462606 RepID=A0A0R0I919_SOYBN|nr:uncharacterized protein LOC100776497 isoform X2 [Glycine max]KAH1140301.1 hypothetical protein GYH30_029273 [Glycine max]KRH35892.1 hypothetical protein GLYMA_10G270400v4 [Glycine max]RZB89332.1 hypothetical protein D0Y65_028264 [Glycine soja]|eukprot:XP_006589667.1 uncharacterized protein LOC100776497 isoform X2 [Glycine max]